jgi:hypothetical protein
MCGTQNEDDAKACVSCGCEFTPNAADTSASGTVSEEAAQQDNQQYANQYSNQQYNQQYANQYNNQQYANQQYANQQYNQQYANQQYADQQYNQQYANQQYANQQYNQQYANQQYNNQQYANQQYANQPYGNQPYPNAQPKPLKISRKAAIIAASVLGVAVVAIILLAVLVWSPRAEIRDCVENYAESIEDGNVRDVVEKTVSKDLLKDAVMDYGTKLADGDQDDLEDLQEYMRYDFDDDYLDAIEDVEDALSYYKINIELENFDAGKVRKANLKSIIEKVYDVLDTDEIEGYTVNDVYGMVEDFADDYDIDLGKVYRVDISYKLNFDSTYYDLSTIERYIEREIEYETDEYVDLDLENAIDHVYVYEYNDDLYVIPGVDDVLIDILSTAIGDSYKEYVEKSSKSNDISSAKTIKTAVETTLGTESAYEEIIDNHANEYILVTESGLNVLSEKTKGYILDNIGLNIPEVKYTEKGYTNFAFKVDRYGSVEVYVTDGKSYKELAPDVDSDYQ